MQSINQFGMLVRRKKTKQLHIFIGETANWIQSIESTQASVLHKAERTRTGVTTSANKIKREIRLDMLDEAGSNYKKVRGVLRSMRKGFKNIT